MQQVQSTGAVCPASTDPAEPPAWSVVIPYYNEVEQLPGTVASLARQSVGRLQLILVDNGSTDGSALLARRLTRDLGLHNALHLLEPEPGQVHALSTGLARVATPFVAVCDADTVYPPDYLARGQAVLEAGGEELAAVLAHDAGETPHQPAARARRWLYTHVMPRLLPRQAHAGGYAHLFRTAALRASGGYSAALWPYVLKDHELIHRVMKVGRVAYDEALWCVPSQRRRNRSAVRWSLPERLLYHATPPALKDWFFYGFLKPRFAARRLRDTVLRVRPG